MRLTRTFTAALCAAVLLIALPPALPAAEPERLDDAFSVEVVPGASPRLEISFALAMSEVSTYPVTITAISGAVEEKLWEGSLTDGIYRLSAPVTKISSGPLKLILKTRVINRSAEGNQTSIVYLKWEGSLSR